MRRIRPLLPLLATALTIASLQPAARSEAPASPPWRCTANGGINVLYCYLRAHGVPCEYSGLEKELAETSPKQPQSLLDLAKLGERHGLPLEAVSLAVRDLSATPLPVIVHIDSDKPGAGAFLLVLNISDKEITYINGPSATIHNLDKVEFLRVWSGTALVAATSRPVNASWAAAGLAGSLVYILLSRKSPQTRNPAPLCT